MIITSAQSLEMLRAAMPLMEWIEKNCHPHCTVHVDSLTAELTELIAKERRES